MFRTLFVGLLAIQFLSYNAIAETQISDDLQDQIESAKRKASRSGDGHVIIGRVMVEDGDDPALVKSQMRILNDGFFAGATRDHLRPVGFRMHGYAPYDLELSELDVEANDQKILDVGVIKMKRLEPRDLVKLKGLLTLEESGDPKSASMSMSVSNGPVNTPSNGTEPRRRWAKSVRVPTDENGLFELGGFSPIKYYCSIKAPGYVPLGFNVDFSDKQDAFLGRVKLETPRRVNLQFICAGEERNVFDAEKTKRIVKAGGDRWKVTPDIYGWDLEFKQARGKLHFAHSYGPCLLADLGKGDLSDFLDIDHDAASKTPFGVPVQDGHVYLMLQKHWGRNVLFKIDLQHHED